MSESNEVRTALGVLALHGAPVTEHEYRELMKPNGITVTAGYLMMQGYLKAAVPPANEREMNPYRWMDRYRRHYELTERGLEALK